MKETYSCETDALKAFIKWDKNNSLSNVYHFKITSKPRYHLKGQPVKGSKPDYYDYSIQGHLGSSLEEFAAIESKLGHFILATNELTKDLDMSKLLSQYKGQQRVEGGFRFLKSPEFFTSAIFLKSPERIESLLMIMTLCLMVYNALEYRIREGLKKKSEYFPNQNKKPTQKPTARWVFDCFSGVTVVYIESDRAMVVNNQSRHGPILRALGPKYKVMYS